MLTLKILAENQPEKLLAKIPSAHDGDMRSEQFVYHAKTPLLELILTPSIMTLLAA